MDQLVWRYTALYRGFMILRDGQIETSNVGVGPDEEPVVWFTTSPLRDPTISTQGKPDYIKSIFGQPLSTVRRQAGILMDVHSALPRNVDVSTTSASSA